MDKNKIIAYSFMGLTLVICIIGYFILPDTLVLQLKFNGDAGTTLSKPLGLLFLLALGVLGGFMAISSSNTGRTSRGYFIMVIFLVIDILVFVFNL